MDPIFGYEAVNVEAQLREPSSLLNWMRRLLSVRKSTRALGRGRFTSLRPGNRKILAFLREYEDEAILCVANLARSAQPVELDLSRFKGHVPIELMGRTAFPPIGELPYLLTLHGHGFFWFRLEKGGEVPEWHEERLPPEELPMLVLFDGWNSFFRERVVPWRIGMADRVCEQLEHDALPRFLAVQRWYAAKGTPVARAMLVDHVEISKPPGSWLMALMHINGQHPATYFAPLSLRWENGDEAALHTLLPVAVARVRQQAQIGVLGDAFADEDFCRYLIDSMREKRTLTTAHGTIRFVITREFSRLAGHLDTLEIRQYGAQSSNTTVRLGESVFLKAYRRVRTGINPEFEIGRYLTETARFPNIVPVAGAIEYHGSDNSITTLAILQTYVINQGDGWSYTIEYLMRYLEDRRNNGSASTPAAATHGGYLALVRTLGRRTAELHQALASPTDNPDFAPEPVSANDVSTWARAVTQAAEQTLDLLAERREQLGPADAADADALLDARHAMAEWIEQRIPDQFSALKTRYHGDYHLGQVLLTHNDFTIIDFEGEPERPLDERRAKHSPLRDVAGMLRSFSYAAATALARQTEGRAELHPVLEPETRAWERETCRAFLSSYAETAGAGGLVADWGAAERLIDLFAIEKALYEVRYELANRPDWVAIPLRWLREKNTAGG